jgi:hypothetical protein
MVDAGFDPQVMFVDGFDDLYNAVAQADQQAYPFVVKAMDQASLAIIGEVKPYPPETAANHPGRIGQDGRPLGYYQRGEGWYYPIYNRASIKGIRSGRASGINRKVGVAGAFGAVAFKRSKKTSEELGRSWAHRIRMEGSEIVSDVGNNASYVLPVQGPINEQSKVMSAIGWEKIDDALDKVLPDIDAAFSDAADEIIQTIAKG